MCGGTVHVWPLRCSGVASTVSSRSDMPVGVIRALRGSGWITQDTRDTPHTYQISAPSTKQSDERRPTGVARGAAGMREGSRVTGSTAFGHGVRAREHTRSQGDVPGIAQLAAREVLSVI